MLRFRHRICGFACGRSLLCSETYVISQDSENAKKDKQELEGFRSREREKEVSTCLTRPWSNIHIRIKMKPVIEHWLDARTRRLSMGHAREPKSPDSPLHSSRTPLTICAPLRLCPFFVRSQLSGDFHTVVPSDQFVGPSTSARRRALQLPQPESSEGDEGTTVGASHRTYKASLVYDEPSYAFQPGCPSWSVAGGPTSAGDTIAPEGDMDPEAAVTKLRFGEGTAGA